MTATLASLKQLPDLRTRTIWNLSFGFFGVQIVYTLQTSSLSRIFSTIGADPNNLSFFWILPPLVGLIVQPFVGRITDRIWSPRLGRRKPFLLLGGLIAAVIMVLLPNAGSFHFSVASALLFGAVCVALLDMSSNMAMQPFKMVVGDLVNERQKTYAYSVQSFLVNASSIVAYLFPFLFTWAGVANTAPAGVVPDSVKISFYVGLAILAACVVQALLTVKEMPPEEYALYHEPVAADDKTSFLTYLKKAPSVFWTVGLVQFFCWGAFLLQWTYSTGAIATNAFGTTDPASPEYQAAGNWYGVVSAAMAAGAVAWALLIPKFKSHRISYSVSLAVGAVGFLSVYFIHGQYMFLVSYVLIGVTWSAMMALPFTILTNALEGEGSIGVYLGLFNCTICLPQIVMALLGKVFMTAFGGHQPSMFIVAAVMLALGVGAVFLVREKPHGLSDA
jgi:maltose/moltooligosaccharide transporter